MRTLWKRTRSALHGASKQALMGHGVGKTPTLHCVTTSSPWAAQEKWFWRQMLARSHGDIGMSMEDEGAVVVHCCIRGIKSLNQGQYIKQCILQI